MMRCFQPLITLLLVLSAATAASAQLDVDALSQRRGVEIETEQRRVMAFYYPWYGGADSASADGHLHHWGRVDRENRDIEQSEHFPTLGPYDSYDRQIIDRHMRWAADAGIDTLIVSWWGHGDYTDGAMEPILEAADEHGLRITAYYEGAPPDEAADSTASDIAGLLDKYADHPAWLTVDGQPVVFIYSRAVNQLGLNGWLRVQHRLADRQPRPLLIGDRLGRISALVFDGIHTYNTAAQIDQMPPDPLRQWAGRQYPRWVDFANRQRRISTITIIPGYDDTKIRNPGLRVRRHDGDLYRAQWEKVLEARPDWVLITSFNEWHEGSEIEPSVERGTRYLELTGRYARRFKALPEPGDEPAAVAPAVSEADRRKLRADLERLGVAILPGGASEALGWMIGPLGLRPHMPTWSQIVQDGLDPDQHGILIYAGGERYRRTVNESGDVDRAIQRYMQQGGCLLVLPAGPMPFHYAPEGETVGSAEKFGLPLRVGGDGPVAGWEQPPEGAALRFVQPQHRLPHLPESVDFPRGGDPRWRPFDATALHDADAHTPLLILRDGDGNYRGDAVTYVELNGNDPAGGRVAYAWFDLLTGPHADALTHDLLRYVADQISETDRR